MARDATAGAPETRWPVGTVKDFITWFDNTWPGLASPEPAH
jgi:hypothetical protein